MAAVCMRRGAFGRNEKRLGPGEKDFFSAVLVPFCRGKSCRVEGVFRPENGGNSHTEQFLLFFE